MTLVAPRIVNSLSCVTRINQEIHFSWQAQYLVSLSPDTKISLLCKNIDMTKDIPPTPSGSFARGFAARACHGFHKSHGCSSHRISLCERMPYSELLRTVALVAN